MIYNNFDDVVDVDIPNRYKLPPRSTMGILPRRYDSFEALRSRYPINRESNEKLSLLAMAFITALYSCDVSKNFEEAIRDLKWKKAMEEEISALDKNETWEKR